MNLSGFLSVTLLLFFCSCQTATNSVNIAATTPVFIDTLPGSCPYLTKDNNGNLVLSWLRLINDTSAVFCYAKSGDGGKTFSQQVVIPPSSNVHPHSENIPKVIFKPSGEIIALWGVKNPDPRNKYSGLVYYTQSFDEGKTWNAAQPLVKDTAGYDQRYFDVALLPDGEAGIIWLDNRKNSEIEGSALYFGSTSGKAGFTNEKMITRSCCQCCRTDLYIDKQNNLHTLYRGIIGDSIRDVVHSVSTDGGKTFSQPRKISNDNWVIKGCPHTGPAMIQNSKGMHFAWYTGGKKKGSYYTQSLDNGASFTSEDSISTLGRHPQLCMLPDERLVTVWDEAVKNNNEFTSLIGVQLRSPEGTHLAKKFVTPPDADASYPVASMTGDGTSLLAYCSKKGDKNYIAVQTLQFR